jgi:hypothetical protein
MIEEFLRLVDRHRQNGILVDANLLLLLVVGRFDERRIQRFERTRDFVIEDFRLLDAMVRPFFTNLKHPSCTHRGQQPGDKV